MFKALTYRVGKLSGHLGYRIVRTYRYPQSTMNLVAVGFSLLRAATDEKIVIVQIGAFDGHHNDPLEPILNCARDIFAVLVEPQPAPCAVLSSRYDGRSDVVVEQAAIAATDGPVRLYLDSAGGATPKASLDPEHVKNFKGTASEVNSIDVEGITLSSLLTRHNLHRIDLMQIDAEGRDFQILSDAFSVGLRPPVVNLESHHLRRGERSQLRTLLRKEGYAYVETALDTFAVRKELIDAFRAA